MRRIWGAASAATLMVLVASVGQGQVPGAPAAPAAPPGAAAAAPAAAEKAGFLKRMCTGFDECKRKLCKTPAGQMINGMVSPLSGLTGGVIPPFCPLMPNAKDLEKPGVAGAAAAAQKEALEAKARRDAVRFLGTLDCRYFPDAAVQLAAALRTDSSECVRYEASLVLGRGCCCTQKTVEALEASVSGMEYDGNPAERSVRVRCAAAIALERCLSCYTPPPVEVEPKKTTSGEVPPPRDKEVKPSDVDPKDKKDDPNAPKKLPVTDPGKTTLGPGQRMPSHDTVEKARKTLNEFNAMLAAYQPSMASQPIGSQSDRQSVYHILKESAVAPASYQTTQMNSVAAASYWSPNANVKASPVNMPQPANLMAPSVNEPVATPEPNRIVIPTATPAVNSTPMPGTPVPVNVPAPMPEMPKTPVMIAPPASPMMPVQPTAAVVTVPTIDPTTAEVNDWAKKALQSSTTAERHAAIRQLVRFDWKQHPMVASALLAGAKADPVDAVRVDCLRHLAAFKMNHPQVVAGVAAMVNDSDPWVRQEAATVLGQLKAGQ